MMDETTWIQKWWPQIVFLGMAIGGYIKLQRDVVALEKEFNADGRIKKLEKYADIFFENKATMDKFISAQTEKNARHDDNYKDIKDQLKDIREILEEIRSK